MGVYSSRMGIQPMLATSTRRFALWFSAIGDCLEQGSSRSATHTGESSLSGCKSFYDDFCLLELEELAQSAHSTAQLVLQLFGRDFERTPVDWLMA